MSCGVWCRCWTNSGKKCGEGESGVACMLFELCHRGCPSADSTQNKEHVWAWGFSIEKVAGCLVLFAVGCVFAAGKPCDIYWQGLDDILAVLNRFCSAPVSYELRRQTAK